MKYVMLGTDEEFNFIGIKSVAFQKTDKFSKMNCKLENSYSLLIFGEKLTTEFTSFLQSDSMVASLLNSQQESENKTNFIELINPVGEIVYRY